MGVQLINLGKRDAVVGMARNAEADDEEVLEDEGVAPDTSVAADGVTTADDVAEQA